MSKIHLVVLLISCKHILCIRVLQNEENDLETSTGGLVTNYVPFYPVQVNIQGVHQRNGYPRYDVREPSFEVVPSGQKMSLKTTLNSQYSPLLSAALIATSLGIPDKPIGYNHPELLPPNPYVALLLSHYGHYIAIPGLSRGLYGYGAVNNYHNNKPFGAYKIYEDNDS